MSSTTPLNNDKHSKLKIKNSNDFTRFKDQHLIPIVIQDFVPLASEFPIAFVKNSETGQFTAVAMMGVIENVNLYCQDANWSASVVPTSFYNYPLSLARLKDEDENCFVCIDTSSTDVNEKEGYSLFTENGEQTDYLKARTEHLLQVADQIAQTNSVIKLLASKKLFILRTLNLKLANDKKLTINGLYIVDEKAIDKLNNEEFNDLRTKGLLPFIYAHLSSMHQIARLAKKQIVQDKV